MSISASLVGRTAGPMVFALILLFVHPVGLSPEANGVLAATAWIAIWWVTEAIPIAATAFFQRTSPAPKETSSFVCVFEKDGLIQINKKHGKYRLIKLEKREIDGSIKGPWSNAKYNPYWHTGRKS